MASQEGLLSPPQAKLLSIRFLLAGNNLFRIASRTSGGSTGTFSRLVRDLISEREMRRFSNKIIDICEQATATVCPKAQALEHARSAGEALFSILIGADLAKTLRQEAPEFLLLEIDDALLSVPWELLHDGEEFLAARYNLGRIVLTPQPLVVEPRIPTRPLRVLVLADPRGELPGAAREGLELYEFLNHLGPEVLADLPREPITADYVRRVLWDYDVIHYAGHADYSRAADHGGSLSLYQNGRLTAKEIGSLAALNRPAPALVFVNACRAGASRRFDPAKVFGLAQAFLSLGARHFISTLFAITDEDPTPIEFAKETYRGIARGLSIGEAVRLSRTGLLKRSQNKS